MRGDFVVMAPRAGVGKERLLGEGARAPRMIEGLFLRECLALKHEAAASNASGASSSLGGLAAILSRREDPNGVVLAGRIGETLHTDKATLKDAASLLCFRDGKVADVW